MDSLFQGNSVKSKRIIYTPSNFAKTNLLHLQEVGELTAIKPHVNSREGLNSFLFFVVTDGKGKLQIILVDDGSTDGSLQIAQEWAAREPRILLLTQPHAGQSVARNLGLSHAEGEYIAFVDADDTLEPDWCEQHLRVIDGVDYVQSGYTRVSKSHSPITNHQFTSPCMRLYRREAIRGMQFVEGMIYEDVVWSVDLWMRGLRCRRIPYCGYHYTLNPTSTTSRRHPEAEKRLFHELKKRLSTNDKRLTTNDRLIILYTLIRLKLHFLCRK